MTPQSTPATTPGAHLVTARLLTGHLSEEQFGELLSGISGQALTSAQAHLATCDQCAAELSSLNDSLSLFRQASKAYADSELRRFPPVSMPARSILAPAFTPMYWAAAAALLLAAILPMQSLRQHTFRPGPSATAGLPESASQSDQALLEDVQTYMSASIPTSMEALADPTFSSPGLAQSSQTSDQTKD